MPPGTAEAAAGKNNDMNAVLKSVQQRREIDAAGGLASYDEETSRELALGHCNQKFAALAPHERVEWAFENLPGNHVMTSSFGAQAAVTLHLITSVASKIPVVLIDTGYLFPETYRFVDELTERLGLNLQVYRAELSPALAGLVGAATLRISGVYFVIFTLGLAELVRQLVSWSQTTFTSRMGLYVFTDFREQHIYWMLLALTVVVFLTGWLINRSRLGFALQIIGNDETVAKHSGIDTARAKIVLFMISGAFIGVAGAIMAPRYSYIEPPSAFNPMISFLVVIMALLGGTKRLWGPIVGVIPFTILMDFISSRFPQHTYIVMGIAFLAIVYLLPHGVTGRLEQIRTWLRRRNGKAEAIAEEKHA